ncbi:MAG: DUF4102 domain-containing protein, partial [Rhodospirillaceae bacterium]|nr:DUF4102 domain-containing protein [Rhodospirillaceae bacterium]
MAKLTKTVVDNSKPAAKDRFIYDDAITGFGLKVTPTGRKVFVLDYRAGRRTRRVTIGKFPDLTAHQARIEAERLRGEIAAGGDPAVARREAKQGVTLVDIAPEFLAAHVDVRLKTSSAKNVRWQINKFILPAIGQRILREIDRGDVARLHHKMRDRPYLANRVLATVSKMMG